MTTIVKKPHTTDIHVGMRVRTRRKMLSMSQTELGKQLGVTFQQVQKYERGTNRIGSSRLHMMSQALNVPVAYFFDGLDQIKEDERDPLDSLRIRGRQALDRLDDKQDLASCVRIIEATVTVKFLENLPKNKSKLLSVAQ